MKKIKIHNQHYSVLVNNIVTVTNTLGNCDSDRNTIYIDSGFPKAKQESSLSHELLHAIIAQSGAITILGEQEETFVTILEDQFYGFLKANTDFFDRFELC